VSGQPCSGASQSHYAWKGSPRRLRLVVHVARSPAFAASDPLSEARATFRYVWGLAASVGGSLRSGAPRSLELSGARALTRCEALGHGLVEVNSQRRA
jgi:hypothetical protein